MTRSELIARLAKTLEHNPELNTTDSEKIEPCTRVLIDAITQSITKGRRIEIRGFGCFELRYRPARIGRNPKIGETVSVSEKYYPHFKPGKDLKERVNFSMEHSLQKNRNTKKPPNSPFVKKIA